MNNLNTLKTLKLHKEIIEKKGFLHNLYVDFYNILLSTNTISGKKVELGSGAGFIKEINPKVITSDVIAGKGIDLVFSASKMPFKSSSISTFYMLDTFHHIKDAEMALKEMSRCLKPNGKIIMIEPFNTPWGKFIYTNFHYEDFDVNGSWKIKGSGRLSDANDALPWIVFVRDKTIFQKKFPKLKIKKTHIHTPISYLISGGLTKPQFLPTFSYKIIRFIEKLLDPFQKYLGMFATIEIVKLK